MFVVYYESYTDSKRGGRGGTNSSVSDTAVDLEKGRMRYYKYYLKESLLYRRSKPKLKIDLQ